MGAVVGLTIGSLFSGIGGLDLAVERVTGGRVAWQCEADPYCRSELARHWPGVPCFDDVVGLEPPPVDILCGGFPCQDISQAGNRKGIDGSRSGLWAEYARIIRILRPGIVVVENVRALVVRGLGRVLGDLAGLRYDAEWTVLGACCVGAPHRRERLFLLAYPQGGVPDPCRDAIRQQYGRGHDAPHPNDAGRTQQRGSIATGPQHAPAQCRGTWPPEPSMGRVVDGFPGRVAQLKALGNAVVPAQAEAALEIFIERGSLFPNNSLPR